MIENGRNRKWERECWFVDKNPQKAENAWWTQLGFEDACDDAWGR